MRALRTFVAVVDCGSVTAAARRLHVAQPSLSRQLRRLEREPVRAVRAAAQTAGPERRGATLPPGGTRLVIRGDLAKEAAAALREGALASVVLSATRTTLTDVIAPFLAAWTLEDPVPAVWEDLPAAIYDSIDRGADLAVGTEAPPPQLERLAIAVLPVRAYIRHDDTGPAARLSTWQSWFCADCSCSASSRTPGCRWIGPCPATASVWLGDQVERPRGRPGGGCRRTRRGRGLRRPALRPRPGRDHQQRRSGRRHAARGLGQHPPRAERPCTRSPAGCSCSARHGMAP